MMSLTRRTMGASTLAILAGCASRPEEAAPAAAAPRTPPAIGAWGIDLTARDMNVKPGDDFFHYANGTWLANTPIPPDRTRWGAFDILRDKSDRDVKAIIEEVAARGGAAGSNEQKIADLYNSYLNIDQINQIGLAPVQAEIEQINAVTNHEQAIRLVATPGVAVDFPIVMYVNLDDRNPDRYVVCMTHSGLGLPEREYYRRTDGQFPQIRQQYVAHIERMLTLVGQTNARAKARRI